MQIRKTIAVFLLLAAVLVPKDATGVEHAPLPHTGDDEISTEDVQTAVREILADRFPAQASKLEVRVVRVRGSASGNQALDIRLPRAESIPRGHTRVRLEEQGARVGWALLYVAHFDSVAIVEENVGRDEEVTASNVSFAWLDVTTFRGEPLRSVTFRDVIEGEKLFATKPLRSGDALRVDDLRAEWAADTGERVVMIYKRDQVILRLTCQAREPGAVGDVIRLYSSDTKTTYKARLTGDGEAEWTSTL